MAVHMAQEKEKKNKNCSEIQQLTVQQYSMGVTGAELPLLAAEF